jgi:hypothetical protein
MPRALLLAVVVLNCFPGGAYSQRGCVPAALARASDEREPILRDLLNDAKRGEVYYVSFGTRKDGAESDPPAGYLKVLADLKLDIRAASAGKRHLQGFRDKKTGKAGALLTVAIHKKVSDRR